MRKIIIEHVTTPDKSSHYIKDKSYVIMLGNCITVRFPDQRHMKAFITYVNEELNFNLVIVNQIYLEVFTHFRKIWFYIDNGHDGSRREGLIKSQFDGIDRTLLLLVTRGQYTNGNHFVFSHFNHVLDNLDTIIKLLQEVEFNRHAGAEVRMLKVLQTKVNTVRTDLAAIGMAEANIEFHGTRRKGQCIPDSSLVYNLAQF